MTLKAVVENNVYVPVRTTRHYFRFRDTNWIQPIMTSNGVLDKHDFAVASNVTPYSGTSEYMLFNNNATSCFHSLQGVTAGEIYLYNPNPLKIVNIHVTNQNSGGSDNRASAEGLVYGKLNGDWELITTYTNSIQALNAEWDINMSNNTKAYYYYRIVSRRNGGADYWTIGEFKITAFEATKANENNHDFYYDTQQYYCIASM